MNKDDLLLQINEQSVLHMPSEDVIDKLKSVSVAGLPIKIVIARVVEDTELGVEPESPLEINDVSRMAIVLLCITCCIEGILECVEGTGTKS